MTPVLAYRLLLLLHIDADGGVVYGRRAGGRSGVRLGPVLVIGPHRIEVPDHRENARPTGLEPLKILGCQHWRAGVIPVDDRDLLGHLLRDIYRNPNTFVDGDRLHQGPVVGARLAGANMTDVHGHKQLVNSVAETVLWAAADNVIREALDPVFLFGRQRAHLAPHWGPESQLGCEFADTTLISTEGPRNHIDRTGRAVDTLDDASTDDCVAVDDGNRHPDFRGARQGNGVQDGPIGQVDVPSPSRCLARLNHLR